MTSTIKVDNIQKTSDGSNIIKKCGSTITIGSSGASVALASGATQTGFGRTGTVDWCTTAKTSPLTVTSGNGYFINTTSGAVTVTLPASPSAGDIVAFSDYANTWQTNNVTVCRNSSLINGGANNAALNTTGSAVTLVYVDGTRGWKQINDATENVTGAPTFIVACGGTVTTSGDFKIHTFTSDGTFTICSAPTPANNNVSYMVVAGGGGGASSFNSNSGGAGGAGGFREGIEPSVPYTGSPLKSCSGLPISVQSYPITVGAGGAGGPGSTPTYLGTIGGNSVFSTITSAGGGRGGSGASPSCVPVRSGGDGGSGGGSGGGGNAFAGGSGNTPPVSPPQGQNGGGSRPGPGPASDQASGGGGGAGGAGGGSPQGSTGGAGGAHVNSSAPGSDTEFSGGAGGTGVPGARGTPGGGGAGSSRQHSPTLAATAGTANTGGGGGASFCGNNGQAGGSGIVVIRYKFQ